MSRAVPALALLLAACGGAELTDALDAWRAGDQPQGLAMARSEYARFRDANDLDEAAVRAAAGEAEATLSEVPVRPVGDGVAPEAPAVAGRGPSELHNRLRRDLLAEDATPVARAVLVVRDLALRHEVPLLFAVVYDRRPLERDGGVLDEASPALRTVAVKRLALDALERL